MEIITRSIHVTGIVQGVGFRYSAREQARNKGLKGRVKNLDDGSVYIEVSGNKNDVLSFITWCHSGPSNARVQNVNVEEMANKTFIGFNIVF